jgi:hypothetical protein
MLSATEIARYWKYAVIVSFALAVFGTGVLLTGFLPVSGGRIGTIIGLVILGFVFGHQYKKRYHALSADEQKQV